MSDYLAVLLLTNAVELLVVALAYRGEWRRMIPTAALATTATHLLMHFGLPVVADTRLQWLLSGEILATVVEAAAYAFVSRRAGWPKALMVSAAANTASFAVGLLCL